MIQQEEHVELREEEGKPPQPPSIKKRIQFTKAQLLGVPLILLIPILALIGLFDAHTQRTSASADLLQLTVEYPSAIRYKRIEPMSIYFHNLSATTIPTVTISVDASYISRFSTVTFVPDVDKVTAEEYVLNLVDVQPMEVRQVAIELQGESYWWHTGSVTATAGNKKIEQSVATFVFP